MIFPKLRKPTYVFQPGCSSSVAATTNDPQAVVVEHLAVADPHEDVSSSSRSAASASSSTAIDVPCGSIALSPVVGTLYVRSCWSSANSAAPLTSV